MAERHEIVFTGAFAGGGGGAAGGGDTPGVESDDAKGFNKIKDGLKDAGGGFWKKIGIDVSIRSLLKQSQIFTSVVGGFFQIIGGFIDIVLMPFIPFLIPIMKKLSSLMPKVMEFSQYVGKGVGFIVKIIGIVFRGIDSILGNVISNSLAPLSGFAGFMGTIIGLLTLMSKNFRGLLMRGARGGFNMMTGGGARKGAVARGFFSGGRYMGRGGGVPIGLGRGLGAAGVGIMGVGGIAGGAGQFAGGQKGVGTMGMLGGGLQLAGAGAMATGVGMPVALGLMAAGTILSVIAQNTDDTKEEIKKASNQTIHVQTHHATLAMEMNRTGAFEQVEASAVEIAAFNDNRA